ncbi:MAG: hypothetical protein CFE34_03875 [Rhodobacteraceae bacterium PARR1]|nr:MAG: hypothetical protein CFE34_03875 [Rhodobacteraceae bacterium PARR1]
MKLPLTLILLGSAMAASAQTPMPLNPPAVHARAITDVGAPLVQVSDEDDDEDGGWLSFGGDGSDEDDCDEDEEDCPTAGRGNAAPAGTVAPPANGLFGDGKAPTASTN